MGRRTQTRNATRPMFQPDSAWVARAVCVGLAIDSLVPARAQQGLIMRCARERSGLSQDELADKVGCSRSTLQRIEAGVQRPGRWGAKLSSALDLEAIHLIETTP